MVSAVTSESILDAHERIKGEVRATPLFAATQATESVLPPCDLYLKLEQLQLTGSFKIRGVMSKITATDSAILKNGLYAASGGNHGRAVAFAGCRSGLKTTVYLPTTTPQEKINMIQRWHAHVVIAGQNLDEANDLARTKAMEENALFIHPYADTDVINGQGTLAVELFDQLPKVETVVMAVGGGGMISGVGTYLKAINPAIRIIGVEPVFCASMYESLKAGKPMEVSEIKTRVGTLAIRKTAELNFQLARACVDQMVLVSDEQMLTASQYLWREFGIAAELSGAAPFAGLMSGQIKVDPSEKVCALICGLGAEGV